MDDDLQHLQQRLDLALQSACFGVWDLDVRRQQVHYSPQWKAMLGYAASDEWDGTVTWRSRVHADDLEPMLEALDGHLQGRHPAYDMEFRLRAADGSYRWVLSRGRVVERDAQGQALRAVGTLTDLTDRRQADTLRIERDRAAVASRAKNEFLSRMSHELRTPLNAILGFSQLLAQRIGTADLAEQRRHVTHIEQAGWRLLRLVDDALELSRLESGHLALRDAAFPLSPLLRSVLASIAALARQHEVTLASTTVPEDAFVQGDPERLQQVLGNLLSHAIHHNHRGGSVTVELRAGTGFWVLAVTDTGPGIAADRLEHLFDAFDHGRPSDPHASQGLRRALSRQLVVAMGGRLTAFNAPGTGSTFELTLPAAAKPALSGSAGRSMAPQEARPTA